MLKNDQPTTYLVRVKQDEGIPDNPKTIWGQVRQAIEAAEGTPVCGEDQSYFAIIGDSTHDLAFVVNFPTLRAALQFGTWLSTQGYGSVTTNPMVPLSQFAEIAEATTTGNRSAVGTRH